MKSNIILIKNTLNIEDNIIHLKHLKDQIKTLQAEYDMLTDELKSGYFADHDEYMTSKGLILATYKSQLRTQFKTTEFKLAEPKLYEQFLDIKELKVFLLK